MYADLIKQTYRHNFDQLSIEKKFHYLCRLNLTRPSKWASQELENIRGAYSIASSNASLALLADKKPNIKHLNAANVRIPLFNEHPWLFGYELQLFYILHARVQFGMDFRGKLANKSEILAARIDELANNPKALAILSTYLVDTFYLQHRIMQSDDVTLLPISTIDSALTQPFDSEQQRNKLNVYLLTHCIIAETLFYSRKLPSDKTHYYEQLCNRLINVVNREWDSLTIDTKLESALCLQLTHTKSDIVQRAIKEADSNFDAKQGFITDSKVPHKNTLEWAEHRNILYIMVCDKRQEHELAQPSSRP